MGRQSPTIDPVRIRRFCRMLHFGACEANGPRFALAFLYFVSTVVAVIRFFTSIGIAGEEAAARYENAVVAADHPLASAAGVEMLKQGGNVVDAAVATSFALSVVRPYSCGIGGGGFMLIWDADNQQAIALDYRERAPLKASREMFRTTDVEGDEEVRLSREGGLAIAVPGTVAGLCFAHEKYGRIPRERIMEPAIRLARDGWKLDHHDLRIFQTMASDFHERPDLQSRFSSLWTKYLNGGEAVDVGNRVQSPQLPILERISHDGRGAFYQGEVADALVSAVQQAGGIWTPDDLLEYEVTVREPVRGRFDELEILGMPPPSSGGVATLQILNTLSAWENQQSRHIKDLGHNTSNYIHLLAEAFKHAFADRAAYLGDADFVNVPVSRLTARDYGSEVARRIESSSTLPTSAYGRLITNVDSGTSHFSILDSRGNAVACTETINTLYGSLVVEPRFGIVLNNEMDDFTSWPGRKNAFGLVQSEANSVAPRKRPLSSMSPTVAVRDGKAVIAVGASGGPRIITSTLQVFLNSARFQMNAADAVGKPRFHHQWIPDELLMEPGVLTSLSSALTRMGHAVRTEDDLAVTQMAVRTVTGLVGAADPRKGGEAAGY